MAAVTVVAAEAMAAAVTAGKQNEQIKNTSHDGRKCFFYFSFIICIVQRKLLNLRYIYAILFTARLMRDTFLAEVFL